LRAALLTLIAGALVAAPAGATVPSDGTGFALADDTYHSLPADEAALDSWYGDAFEALGPRSFRFQLHWNADPVELDKAARLIDWVRAHGVTQVVVTFKKNGPTPSADAYAQSIAPLVQALAGRVEAWGPANEPNLGDAWLPGLPGAELLAAYWQRFVAVVDAADPSALKLSPEFADGHDLQPLSASYLGRYVERGGGFGDVVGWHAYWGAHNLSLATTDAFLDQVPPDLPVWVTEVGGFGRNLSRSIADPDQLQNAKLLWLTSTLARHPRVERIFYYHARDTGQPDWDSALMRRDGTRRPAWFTWCVAAHGGNFGHPDCTPTPFLPAWVPQL
jgi:hypothetical protein